MQHALHRVGVGRDPVHGVTGSPLVVEAKRQPSHVAEQPGPEVSDQTLRQPEHELGLEEAQSSRQHEQSHGQKNRQRQGGCAGQAEQPLAPEHVVDEDLGGPGLGQFHERRSQSGRQAGGDGPAMGTEQTDETALDGEGPHQLVRAHRLVAASRGEHGPSPPERGRGCD